MYGDGHTSSWRGGVPASGRGGPGTEGRWEESGVSPRRAGQGGGVPRPPQPAEGRQPRGEHVQWNHRHPEGQGGEQGLGCLERQPSFQPGQPREDFPAVLTEAAGETVHLAGESAGLRAQRGGHFIQRTERVADAEPDPLALSVARLGSRPPPSSSARLPVRRSASGESVAAAGATSPSG